MPFYIQPSFARGEIAPALYGRVDTNIYSIGLRTARNTQIETSGGISNRAGTAFVAIASSLTADPRLIPFNFSTTDKYDLEFGDFKMRVFRNQSAVLESGQTISGATQANPCVLTITGHTLSDGDEISVYDVAGMTELNSRRYIVANSTANTIELTDRVTGSNVDSTSYTAYTSAGEAAKVYELTTPYAIADTINLKYQQTADVMTLTHKSYETQELTRTGHASWTIGKPDFIPATDFPTGQTVSAGTPASETERYQVTAVTDNPYEESLPALNNTSTTITGATQANPVVLTITGHPYANGDEIHVQSVVGMTELNNRRFIVANSTTNTLELEGEDGTGHTAYSSAGTVNATFVEITNGNATRDNTVSWTAVSGASRYIVYYRKNGLYSFLGETELTSFLDSNITVDATISPPKFRDPFFGSGNYPGAVGYHEQRRVFGGSTNKPDTSEYSHTGKHSNFTISQPLQADDAIVTTLDSGEVNEIRHYVPGTDLLVMTSGGEWRVNSGADSGFAHDTLKQKPQSFWGVSHHRPVVAGDVVLFVGENNSSVRNLGYSLEKDRYLGTDLTLVSEHLLKGRTIVDTAFTTSPAPRKYMVLDNGHMLTMTYNPSQDMVAWTRWDTLGKFKRVSTLRTEASSTEDSITVVVSRVVNGTTVRFIETVKSRIFDTPHDCYFVDCGKTLDDPYTITGATAADPVVITCTGHPFSNGDEVDIFDIEWTAQFDADFNETQPDQLNGKRFKVANKTANTFELTDPEDGSNIDGSAFEAYVEGGTARLATDTISGMHYLLNEDVIILADGNVVTGKTVSATGVITLDRKASRVHAGKRYISDIETLDIEAPQGQGTIQGLKTRVIGATIRFEKSRGLLTGPKTSKLREMKQREAEKMSDPTALLTGDKYITFDPTYSGKGRMFIRQIFPLPMTILAVVPEIDIGR